MNSFAKERAQMVCDQLRARGIADERTLAAMERVPREEFVPAELRQESYSDSPLPIGHRQTISQPLIVAQMTELARLSSGERVLEIGTGSGYAAAVLAELVRQVFSIERIEALAHEAQRSLDRLGYAHVQVIVGDGSLGDPEHAPYDAIIVTAAAPWVPPALVEQLAPGGRLIIPVGDPSLQTLKRFTKLPSGELREESFDLVRFVPLIGEQGW